MKPAARPVAAAPASSERKYGHGEKRACQRDAGHGRAARPGIAFTEHPYDYVEHGGTPNRRQVWAWIRARGGQDAGDAGRAGQAADRADARRPHGVAPRTWPAQIGVKSVEPCKPEVAQRHSGYLVGGTSPFGTRKAMPVYVERSVLALPRIAINGGRRGFLVGIEPAVLRQLLGAQAGGLRAGRLAGVPTGGKRLQSLILCHRWRPCWRLTWSVRCRSPSSSAA